MRRWLFPWGFLIFFPLSLWLYEVRANTVLVFIMTFLAIVPATSLIAKSTHELSLRTSTAVGSLLNASFGNAIELFISIFAIRAGLVEMVGLVLAVTIITKQNVSRRTISQCVPYHNKLNEVQLLTTSLVTSSAATGCATGSKACNWWRYTPS